MNKEKIYQLIRQKGMKMSFLVDNSGVSRKTFYDYLNGRLTASSEVIKNVADSLGVTIGTIKA